jgi:Tfp pilus assembly protein PilO
MKKNKFVMYAVSGVFVASLLFGVFSFIYSSIENISARGHEKKMSELKEKQEEAAGAQKQYSQWQNIDKTYEKFKDDYLMKIDDFSEFRNELNVIFMKNRLEARGGVNHKYTKGPSDIIKIQISFTVSGSYPNIKRFIHDIANKEKIIPIKEIQFATSKTPGDIVAKFSMEVYLVR